MAIAATAARPCQWEADTKPLLGSQPVGSVVLTHGLNGEPLRFPLHLFYVPDALAKGTPVNRSIYKLTNGLAPRKWSGNVRNIFVHTSIFPSILTSPLPRLLHSNTVAQDDRRTLTVRQTICQHWFPTFYPSSKPANTKTRFEPPSRADHRDHLCLSPTRTWFSVMVGPL